MSLKVVSATISCFRCSTSKGLSASRAAAICTNHYLWICPVSSSCFRARSKRSSPRLQAAGRASQALSAATRSSRHRAAMHYNFMCECDISGPICKRVSTLSRSLCARTPSGSTQTCQWFRTRSGRLKPGGSHTQDAIIPVGQLPVSRLEAGHLQAAASGPLHMS